MSVNPLSIDFFLTGQTGAATSNWQSVPGEGRGPRSVLVEVVGDVYGTCSVAIQSRVKREVNTGDIRVEFTATANTGNWLDMTGAHEVRAVITGAGGTNVNARLTF